MASEPTPQTTVGPILGLDPDDLDVLIYGGAMSSAVDRMSLYEATLQIELVPELKARMERFDFKGNFYTLVFHAKSDVDAGREIARIREEGFIRVIFRYGTVPTKMNLGCKMLECIKLVRIVRHLFLRPSEDLLELSQEYVEHDTKIMLLLR